MRYTLKFSVPEGTVRPRRPDFPGLRAHEVPSARKKDHSVLANSVVPEADHDLRVALDETLAFLDHHLAPRGPSA